MKVKTDKIINKREGLAKANNAKALSPSRLIKNNDISFGANYQKIISKGINSSTTYTNINKIASNIDDVLGDNFFTSTLQKANIAIENDRVSIKQPTLLTDIFETIKYPFVGLPLDLTNWALRGLKKTPFKKSAQALLDTNLLSKRAQKVEVEKSYNLARDILEKFSTSSTSTNIDKCSDKFREDIASGITKISKNYNSRDERTLNRAVTATVSALYSACDFYNISLLQKDDKEEAKKAQKARFKQEMTRMGLSAGMTFFTLGALERYVKNNVIANSLVIALSSLTSEVVSRVFNHTPLHPLTPEEAKKTAQKTAKNSAQKKTEKTKDTQQHQNNQEQNHLTFKNRFNDKNFIQFAQKDGTYTPLNHMTISNAKQLVDDIQSEDKNKKSKSIKTIVGLAFASASVLYLFNKIASGKYKNEWLKREWFIKYKDKINAFNSNTSPKLDENIKVIFDEIKEKDRKIQARSNFIRNSVTKKDKLINLDELKHSIEKLKTTKEGKTISTLLDEYLNHIDLLIKTGSTCVTAKEKRFLIPGVYDGVTKIVKMVYQIFSLPAAMLNGIADKYLFKNSSKAFNKVDKKININCDKLKQEVLELSHICKKHSNNPQKAIEQIKKNIRNFETGSETGELANISRTMVTCISTYFFVNDYRNKVLIESEGRDIQEAKEETKNRIAHKLSNFVINGTLMNLFNSIFKVPLNRSLVEASLIATTTEATNEFLVRKSICQPTRKMNSKQDILEYEEKQLNKKGLMGLWSKTFMKLTGKKTLTQKAGVNNNDKK